MILNNPQPVDEAPPPAWARPVNLTANAFPAKTGSRPAIKPSEGLAVYRARMAEHASTSDIKALKPVVMPKRGFTPASIVCGGWDLDDGIDALLAEHRLGLDADGHVVGFPDLVEVYVLGDDEQASVPVRPHVHPFEFDKGVDDARLLLTPTAVVIDADVTRVVYAVEEAE